MTQQTQEKVIDLGGPDGGRYWRVVSDHAVDDPNAHSAAVHARLTGSTGCTYNNAKVERWVPLAGIDALDGEIAEQQRSDRELDALGVLRAGLSPARGVNPREHDEATAALYDDMARANAKARSADAKLMRLAGFRRPWGARGDWWVMSNGDRADREMADQVLSDRDHSERNFTEGCTIPQAQEEEAEVIRERRAIQEKLRELGALYTGWSRFFLVTSSSGHVHSSMHCSTCRPTTTYGWVPELSGKTEADAVALLGPALCSVCFSSAPAAMVGGKITKAAAERRVAEAEHAVEAPSLANGEL